MRSDSQVSGHHAAPSPTQTQPLRLAHISDLHFGRTEPRVTRALRDHLNEFEPELIIVTGDLTQRARPAEFRAACHFLGQLSAAKLVVPGNHDITPLYQPFGRLFRPRAAYRRWVGGPQHVATQDFIAVGLDTVSRWRLKEGSIARWQIERTEQLLESIPRGLRIIASHHPLVHPERRVDTRHRGQLLTSLDELRVDVALSGHLHGSWSGSRSHRETPLSTLFVEASTATSTRLRGAPNAYNQLVVTPAQIEVRVCAFEDDRFRVAGPSQGYARAFASG